MHLLDLIGSCKGAEMSVFMAMLAAHAMGADTVRPSWLMVHVGQSDKTLAKHLARIQSWGLAEQVTTQQWRLTLEGRSLEFPAKAGTLRLFGAEPVDKSVDNPVDNPTGSVVDAVSLRRKFSDFSPYVGDSPTFLCSGGSRENQVTLLNQPQQPHQESRKFSDFSEEAQNEAERLARMLTSRIVGNWRSFALELAGQIDEGTPAQVLELDLLLWAAFIRHGKSNTIRNPAAFVLKMLRSGQRAPRAERETLAAAGPGWGEQHPDLERVDELINWVDSQGESGHEHD